MACKYLKIIIILIVSICYGCVAPSGGGSSRYSNYNKVIDISESGVIHKPVIADLDVKATKVSGTAEGPASAGVVAVRTLAIENALKPTQADVLVEPKYEIIHSAGRYSDVEGRITVNVTGYPATYKNFRSIAIDDSTWVKMRYLTPENKQAITVGTQNNTQSNQSKKSILGTWPF